MTPQQNQYWSCVWARLVLHRIKDETWQSTFVIPKGFSHNRCFNVALMEKATQRESLAWDVFNHDFPRLRPDLQIALSGSVHHAWLKREAATRGIEL